jgi:hypothetical protein
MTSADISTLQLVLAAVNTLALPALYGIARWLMRVELRLARLEWQQNPHAKVET